MKFKVGDKVTIIGFESCCTDILWIPEMNIHLGEIRTIEKYIPYSRGYKLQGLPYSFYEEWLKPVNDQKILITTDGKETKARLYDGKKVIKESVAKCSPKDEFDFETGAEIAFNRLVKKKKVSELYNGKIICTRSASIQFTKGKIYTVENGHVIGNNYIGADSPFRYNSLEAINKNFQSDFIELVED